MNCDTKAEMLTPDESCACKSRNPNGTKIAFARSFLIVAATIVFVAMSGGLQWFLGQPIVPGTSRLSEFESVPDLLLRHLWTSIGLYQMQPTMLYEYECAQEFRLAMHPSLAIAHLAAVCTFVYWGPSFLSLWMLRYLRPLASRWRGRRLDDPSLTITTSSSSSVLLLFVLSTCAPLIIAFSVVRQAVSDPSDIVDAGVYANTLRIPAHHTAAEYLEIIGDVVARAWLAWIATVGLFVTLDRERFKCAACCAGCAYPRLGNPTSRCPECGLVSDAQSTQTLG